MARHFSDPYRDSAKIVALGIAVAAIIGAAVAAELLLDYGRISF